VFFKDRTGETILLNNYPVHDVIKHGIVRTFQNVELIKEVTVLENLLIGGHVQYRSSLVAQFLHLPILKKEELAVKKKALEVLEFMGLSLYKDMLAWGLPYGVLKKIEIARTLMNNPQLIILDEPAAGLNDSETADLAKLIKKIQQAYNCTILLVEHDMGLVMDICDTVCAISFGKLLGIGTAEEIQANPKVQEAYLGSSEDE
jgi:branched-chain amino acid transport system ATP-binding protein